MNKNIASELEMLFDKKQTEMYRRAFSKKLLRKPLTESDVFALENRSYVHTGENSGALIPESLQNEIYSYMEESHPLLKDVKVIHSGATMDIVVHSDILSGDAKNVTEGENIEEEKNKFTKLDVEVNQIVKSVYHSIGFGTVAIDALEEYFSKEIGERISSQWVKNIVAQIKFDLSQENKIESANLGEITIDDFKRAIGLTQNAGSLIAYGRSKTFYDKIAASLGNDRRIGLIPDYDKSIVGQILGIPFKEEDALDEGEILIDRL